MDNFSKLQTVALTTSAATTPEIDLDGFAGGSGSVVLPASSSITSLTYHGQRADGTYAPAQDAAGAVTQTVAQDKGYLLPAAVFRYRKIRIVANAAGSVDLVLCS
jgi:hypothetical protein